MQLGEYRYLFGTPIQKYHYPKRGTVKRIINQVVNDCETDPERQKYITDNGDGTLKNYYNRSTYCVLDDYPDLKPFYEWIRKRVSKYSETLMGFPESDWFATGMWINVNFGAEQGFHIHSNSLISWCYYAEFDPDVHTGLTFASPNNPVPNTPSIVHNIDPNYNFNNHPHPYAKKDFYCDVDEGELVIFPSELNHGYWQPPIDKPRITISGNMMPKRIDDGSDIGNYGYGFEVKPICDGFL